MTGLCRGCGVHLPRELILIGICAWCVADSMRPPLTIPRPRYGFDGEDDEPGEEDAGAPGGPEYDEPP